MADTVPRRIWGTDVYTDDSSICTAAVHAGVLQPGKAGLVTVVVGSGASVYLGSLRNNVTSVTWGPSGTSFSFDTSGGPGQVDWTTTAAGIPAEYTDPVIVDCPPGGETSAYIWGTDRYTTTSSVCVAAVHAAVIQAVTGGRITVTSGVAQTSYTATTRNGVTSYSYGAWPNSFTVSATPTAIAATLNPNLSRSILLAGFTGVGSVAGVAPRTLSLSGFAANGVSGSVAARTVTLAGFTAAGVSAVVARRTISLAGWTASGPTP